MRPRVRHLLTSVALLVLCTGVVAAQFDRPRPGLTLTTRFLGSLLINLVVGALLVGIAPDYSAAVVRRILEEPVSAVVTGIVVLLLFVGVVFVLALLGPLAILGLLLAIPMVVVGIVGGALGTIAIGTVIADAVTEASLWHGVLVGAVLTAVMNLIPVLGGIGTFVVSSAGVGVVCLRIYEGW